MVRILIVDDDPDTLELVADSLTAESFEVQTVPEGRAARNLLRYSHFDLLILDWNLPGMSGTELCRFYREHGGVSPVMIFTGNDAINDKVYGFECGADDYLTKPFMVAELIARVRAHLRRAEGSFTGTPVIQFEDITLDQTSHRVRKDNKEVKLLPKEFSVLELFLRHPSRVFSAETILQKIWGSSDKVTPDVVRTYIMNIRKKLDSENLIETVHGVGYRLKSSES